jgi:hypothetical protein
MMLLLRSGLFEERTKFRVNWRIRSMFRTMTRTKTNAKWGILRLNQISNAAEKHEVVSVSHGAA